jgi:DNA-binding transcriptional regulator YdaS (Cro superfamily)
MDVSRPFEELIAGRDQLDYRYPMANSKERDPGVEIAIAEAGGVRALARLVGVPPSAVSVWKLIPVKHVLKIEEATGIPKEELRPDIFLPSSRRSKRKRPLA